VRRGAHLVTRRTERVFGQGLRRQLASRVVVDGQVRWVDLGVGEVPAGGWVVIDQLSLKTTILMISLFSFLEIVTVP